jgi:hypothetical protein
VSLAVFGGRRRDIRILNFAPAIHVSLIANLSRCRLSTTRSVGGLAEKFHATVSCVGGSLVTISLISAAVAVVSGEAWA